MKNARVAILVIASLARCASTPPPAPNPESVPLVAASAARHKLLAVGTALRAERRATDPTLLRQLRTARPGSKVTIEVVDDLVYEATTDGVRKHRDAIVWRGTIADAKFWGAASLVVHGSKIVGNVQVDDRYFAIRDDDDEATSGVIEQLIAEVDERLFPAEGEALKRRVGVPPALADVTSAVPRRAKPEEPVTISVLLVIPPQLAEWCEASKMQLMEAMSMASLDGVWASFTRGAVAARVSSYCTTHESVGGTLQDDLDWVTSDPDVQAQRTATKSNVVVFIVPDGTNCGMSQPKESLTQPDAAALAFSVVKFNCAWNNYSLAHEIGHVLGMSHDRYTERGGYLDRCSYGYSILRDGAPIARDVMSYSGYCTSQSIDCPRIGTYSYANTVKGLQFGVDCSVTGDTGTTTGAASNVDQLLIAAPIAVTWQ